MKREVLISSLSLAAMLSCVARAQTVLFVDDDAQPAGDGSSWSTAYRFLQDALTHAANSAGVVQEIRVAQGVHFPDRDESTPTGTGDREATLQLLNGVALRGGYAGFGAPDPNDRDIAAYLTTLSGDLANNDEPAFVNRGDNSLNIVTAIDVGQTAIIEGFEIRAGNADGTSGSWAGSGMDVQSASPLVVRCTFRSNMANTAGAMRVVTNSSPEILHCTFEDNRANASGAGILVGGLGCSPVIDSCTFCYNGAASSDGGGVYNAGDSATIIENSSFSTNIAERRGGAVFTSALSETSIINCTFEDNSAGEDGGAIFNDIGSELTTIAASWFCTNTPNDISGTWIDEGDNVFSDICDPCVFADIDGDTDVGFGDLLILLAQWGPCPPNCFGDLDSNGEVGFQDLLILLAAWGPCP